VTVRRSARDSRWTTQRAFYLDEHPRLSGYLRRRLPDTNTAEDVAHEVWTAFMAVWERAEATFNPSPKLLFRIAQCRYANWWRDHGSTAPELHPDPLQLAGILGYHDPGDTTDLRIDLSRALAELTPRQRQAIHLRHLDDLPMNLVGDQLGITERGARKAVTSALTTLRGSVHLTGYRETRREVL
jgi:RNA polymerase sigma factor (sigma-70 family)